MANAIRRRKGQVQVQVQAQAQAQSPGSVAPGSSPVSSPAPASSSTTSSAKTRSSSSTMTKSFLGGQPAWVGLAIASGACAAINGVFAKLTTTSLTSNFSSHISSLLGLAADNTYVNVLLRGTFFGLNLLFNGIMWGLFTAALTKGNSTTRVSIVNVSANFFLTAILGWLIFSEKLPLQWWLGAALLACGNVVIGKREEDETSGAIVLDQTSAHDATQREELLRESTELARGDLLELDETLPGSRKGSHEEDSRLRRGNDIDDPI